MSTSRPSPPPQDTPRCGSSESSDSAPLPSYWLLADDQLPLATKPSLLGSLVAHFKHSLLFHRRLLISDSQIIHNANLRRAIRGTHGRVDSLGPDFRDLFTKDCVAIAVRRPEPEANALSLVEVQRSFVARGTLILKSSDYGYTSELEYVERSAEVIPYAISDVTEVFTKSALCVIESEIAHRTLGDNMAKRLLALAQERRAADGKLERYFFNYDLEKKLEESEWKEHSKAIRELISGPYLGALPLLIGANPIYAEDHRTAFEVLRGAIVVPEWESPVVFDSRLGLLEYVRGLNALPAERIHALRASSECAAMHAAVARLDGTHVTMQYLVDVVRSYQLRIEDEIVQFVGRQLGDAGERQRRIVPFHSVSTTNNIASLGGAVVGFLYSSMVLNILGLILSALPFGVEALSARQQRRRARAKEDVRDALSIEEPVDRVRARTVFDSPTRNETLYFDIRSGPGG